MALTTGMDEEWTVGQLDIGSGHVVERVCFRECSGNSSLTGMKKGGEEVEAVSTVNS